MRFLVSNRTGDAPEAIADAFHGGWIEFGETRDWGGADSCRYAFGGWTLDATTRLFISPSARRVDLTSSEFDLLMAFVRRPGQPLSRSTLLAALRGREWTYFDRSIDTLVARLRKKISAECQEAPLIRSVRGIGYVFCAGVARTL